MAYYCLTNVKFDNSYKNGCFFSNSQVREEALHPINYNEIKKEINFDFGKITYTSINVKEYQNQNYCIIEYDNNFYYYFITEAFYYAANSWRLTLELDVITQYITGANAETFSVCNIARAHCNRWIRNGNNVKFDVSPESQIIKHETKIDKVSKKRNKVNFNFFNNTDIDTWYKQNILCWIYLYIDSAHEYTVIGYQGSSMQLTPIEYKTKFLKYEYIVGDTPISNDFSVIGFPIYKSNNKIVIKDNINNSQCYITIDTLKDFYDKNNNSEYIYNIKLSNIPPCDFTTLDNFSYDIDQGGNLIINVTQSITPTINRGWHTGIVDVECFGNVWIDNNIVTRNGCFVDIWQQFDVVRSEEVNTQQNFTFTLDEVKGNKNQKFEPKVLLDCYNIVIRDSANGEFNYNLLHAGNKNIKTLYTEGLNITNNNYYYRLESSGIIPADNQDNWNGIVNTVDYSQIVANSNISNFLSDNKNFLLTKGASIGIPLLSSLITGNISGVIGAGTETFKTITEIDNLLNRVNSLRNTNDSVVLNLIVNEGLNFYVDIEAAYQLDINSYYNYIYSYGYSINKIDNPFNYFNTRKYFNYLQFDAEYININVPSNVEDKIKNIFSNGIRLWNDYSTIYEIKKENYEIYLDAEV